MNTVAPRARMLRQVLGKTNIEEQRSLALLTIGEACEILRTSKWTIYRLLHEGRLKSVKLGSRRLIPAASLSHLVEQLSEAEEWDRN